MQILGYLVILPNNTIPFDIYQLRGRDIMRNGKMARYDVMSEVFKAIAHPTRLLIIEELGKQKRCVSEITEMVGADTSTVSKHLALMKSAGIITNEKLGNQVFYSLRVICILNLINCVESAIESHAKEKIESINS